MEVVDSYSFNQTAPLSDSQYGGTQDWQLLGWHIDHLTNLIKVKAMRKMKTADAYDADFERVLQNWSYAYAGQTFNKFKYHGDTRGQLHVNLKSNDTRVIQSGWEHSVVNGHTQQLALFWGLLVEISVFFARYMKSYPKYIQVHGIVSMLTTFVTFFYGFSMISLSKLCTTMLMIRKG